MSKIIKDAVILTIITLVAGLGLGFVYDITVVPIQKAQEEKKQKAYRSVMPEGKEFVPMEVKKEGTENFATEGFEKQTIKEVVEGKDASGTTIGYVITVVSNQGFGGPIEMSLGISSVEAGKITGLDFLSMSESPGLGDNAKKPEFKDVSFKDKTVERFEVIKDKPTEDFQVQAITGATISSNAVTQGVNAALLYFKQAVVGGAMS